MSAAEFKKLNVNLKDYIKALVFFQFHYLNFKKEQNSLLDCQRIKTGPLLGKHPDCFIDSTKFMNYNIIFYLNTWRMKILQINIM